MTTGNRQVGNGARWMIGLAILAILVLLSCAFVLPRLIVPDRTAQSLNTIRSTKDRMIAEDSRTKLQNDVRTTLVQGVAGAFFLITAFFTWRQTRTSQEQLEVNQGQLKLTREQLDRTSEATQEQLKLTRQQLENTSKSTQEQLRLSREEQTAELFTRAVDQLGSQDGDSKNVEIRIGGIYALERIAKQSPEDSEVVAEVLTAYIRSQSPWPPPQTSRYPADHPIQRVPALRVRAPDIQTALTVLGRLKPVGKHPPRYELSRTDLRRAHLDGNFEGAGFQESNLESAIIISVKLRDADFGSLFESDVAAETAGRSDQDELEGANLKRANLGSSDLRGADFYDTNLERTFLASVDARNASFIGTRFVGTDLTDTDLRKATIAHVTMQDLTVSENTKWPEGFDLQAHVTSGEDSDSS